MFQFIGTQLSTFINRIYLQADLTVYRQEDEPIRPVSHLPDQDKRSIREWWEENVDVNAPGTIGLIILIWKTCCLRVSDSCEFMFFV
jgi:hypothetical protein